MDVMYFHTANSNYIRVSKFLKSFKLAGVRCTYFGAVRGTEIWAGGEDCVDSGVRFGHGYRSIFSLLIYVWRGVIFLRNIKPNSLIITNEELYLIPFLAGYRGQIILDGIDALDVRTNRGLLGLLSMWVRISRRRANLVIEVEEFRKIRFPSFVDKTVVVRNIPNKSMVLGEGDSKNIFGKYIFAYGSLREGINGVEELLKAVSVINTGDEPVRIVIAGVLNGSKLEKLVLSSPDIVFLGCCSHEECISLARNAIAIFAFYRPVNQNFIMAAPNKYYEAIEVKNTFIINSECKISRHVVSEGHGYAVEYENVLGLQRVISQCKLESRARNEHDGPVWDEDFEKVLRWMGERGIIDF